MKIEDQVVSLELAKRLKELGVKQESHFRWCDFINKSAVGGHQRFATVEDASTADALCERPFITLVESFAAFTVAELGEMLPVTLGSGTPQIDVEQFKYATGFGLELSGYRGTGQPPRLLHSVFDANEAKARGKMLALLIEKGLVKP